MPQLSGEVNHLNVGLGRGRKTLARGGPIEESEGLEERDAVADATAFLEHAADDGWGRRMGGGDSRKIEGEIGDSKIGGGWRGVRVRARVLAVMVLD